MKRVYNGTVNMSFRRDLRRLIGEYWDYYNTWIEEIAKEGSITVDEDFSLFRESIPTTFHSEKEIEDFLTGRLNKRLDDLQKRWKLGIFERMVIDFIRRNAWKYPSPGELMNIATEAEAERIQIEGMTPPITSEIIAREILRLCSEIMEQAREKPSENWPEERVFTPVNPYPEEFSMEVQTYRCDMEHGMQGSDEGDLEYRCKFFVKYPDIDWIEIRLDRSGTTYCQFAINRLNQEEFNWKLLLSRYKGVLERAKEYQIEFLNEIDFDS